MNLVCTVEDLTAPAIVGISSQVKKRCTNLSSYKRLKDCGSQGTRSVTQTERIMSRAPYAAVRLNCSYSLYVQRICVNSKAVPTLMDDKTFQSAKASCLFGNESKLTSSQGTISDLWRNGLPTIGTSLTVLST